MRLTFSFTWRARQRRASAGVVVLMGWMIAGNCGAAQFPSIGGVWNRYPPYADTFSGQPDPPELQVATPPLKPSYLREWQDLRKRREEADADGKPLPTPASLCLPEGMPGLMDAHYALQILVNPDQDQVTVLGEFMMQVRRIYLAEPMPPLEKIAPSYFGYSVASWKGKRLEVTTLGVNKDVRYEDIPHSERMKITERLYLTKPDILRDDITIDDPDYMTEPYKFTFLYKREPSSYKVGEYVCDHQHAIVGKDGALDMKLEAPDGAEKH